ncbi:hypothetical protein PS706_03309 [Pseudomonas fluorescens]|nr:hypothetical protein PS706_03309 [Pseudomonas fluorescens]
MGKHDSPRVFDVLHHQVTQGLQVECGVTWHQGHPAASHPTGRDQWIVCTGFAGALDAGDTAIHHVDAAHGGTAQLHVTPQVDQYTIAMVTAIGDAGRVQCPTDAHTQIAATGQLQAAIAGDTARTAHGQHQALAMRVRLDMLGAVAQRVQYAGVAADIDIHVPAAEGTEAGKAEQFVRRRRRGVTAEIDPPRRRLGLPACRHVAAALAPQPVADGRRVHAGIPWVGSRRVQTGDAGDVAGQVAADSQRQVAPGLRVPGTVDAGGRTIDELFKETAGVIQHGFGRRVSACRLRLGQVVRVAGKGAGRRGAGRVDAVQRIHAQAARTQQLKVTCAGADDAKSRA